MTTLNGQRILDVYLRYNGNLYHDDAQKNLQSLGIDHYQTYAIAELLGDGVMDRGEYDKLCPNSPVVTTGCLHRFDGDSIRVLESFGNSPATALRKKLLAEKDSSKLPVNHFPDIKILFAMGDEEFRSLDNTGVRNVLIWMLAKHIDPNRFVYIESRDYWVNADDGCGYSDECLEESAREREEIHQLTPEEVPFLKKLIKSHRHAGKILSQIEQNEKFIHHIVGDGQELDFDATQEIREEVIPNFSVILSK